MEDLVELTQDELVNTEGGSLTAMSIVIGLCGFGAGVIIGAAVAYALYYALK
jgi:lactobin A/cerein 7B family class IIb bacteriocin